MVRINIVNGKVQLPTKQLSKETIIGLAVIQVQCKDCGHKEQFFDNYLENHECLDCGSKNYTIVGRGEI